MRDVTAVSLILQLEASAAEHVQAVLKPLMDHGSCVRDLANAPPAGRRGIVPQVTDALVDTIDEMGAQLHSEAPDDRPSRVLVVVAVDAHVLTAGMHSARCVQARVTRQRDVYKWAFLYLGTQHEVADQAAAFGIPADHALAFAPGAGALVATAAALGRVVEHYVHTQTLPAFTDEERQAAATE